MGWWAHLDDDRGHEEGVWNYTHNVGPMLNAALVATGTVPAEGLTWWRRLDGLDGATGAVMLAAALGELVARPDVYQPMSPPNGWGSYDGIVDMLREMVAAVPEWPTVWTTSG